MPQKVLSYVQNILRLALFLDLCIAVKKLHAIAVFTLLFMTAVKLNSRSEALSTTVETDMKAKISKLICIKTRVSRQRSRTSLANADNVIFDIPHEYFGQHSRFR